MDLILTRHERTMHARSTRVLDVVSMLRGETAEQLEILILATTLTQD